MKIDKRAQQVSIAETKLKLWIYEEWMREHNLTFVEALSCVSNITSEIASYVLRAERHHDASEDGE